MTFWEPLALLGVLAFWGVLGLVPWWVALVVSRGRSALIGLLLAFAAGVGGGALVPALGGKDALGFAISLLTAFAAGAIASTLLMRRTMRTLRKESS